MARQLLTRALLVPLLFLLGPRVAHATIFVLDPRSPLAMQADTISYGSVRTISSRWEAGRIVSDVQIEVSEMLKGEPARYLTVVAPGGKVGDVAMRVLGSAEFRVGDRSIVFAARRQGAQHLLGLGAGKLDVHARSGIDVVTWQSGDSYQELPLARVLDELRMIARQRLR